MNVISIKLTDEQLAWLQEQKDNRDRSIASRSARVGCRSASASSRAGGGRRPFLL